MSQPPEVQKITAASKNELVDTMLIAFATDPVARFGFVTPTQYLHGMQIVFAGTATPSLAGGGAWLTAGAGAMWLAPGTHTSEEEMADILPYLEPSRAQTMGELLGQMAASHPDEPHWYLNFIGVDPQKQGQGLGSAVLKRSLAQVDEQGLVAYLESSNPVNVPLYERFGFEVTGEIQLKDSPVVYPMVRPANKP